MENISESAKKLRNAYQNNWRRKNPEKVKMYADNYWERKAASYSIVDHAKSLKAQGMTQREIAKQLNVSIGTVNKYLNKQ